jgi:hypothetical protein
LETTLTDPEFHATRSRETHCLIADLETTKVEVAHLYERWQELAARTDHRNPHPNLLAAAPLQE